MGLAVEMRESALIALDVALVPPEPVQERARRVSQELAQGGLLLDDEHIPHVSLAQLFVRRATVPLLTERLSLVLCGTSSLEVTVLAVVEQQATVSFLIDRTPQLLSLHTSLMDALQEWEEEDGDAAAFYANGEAARDKDVDWVANFRSAASYRQFIPHITLGIGPAPKRIEPFAFTAARIGLFHLGRFCTCRRLLHEWRLR